MFPILPAEMLKLFHTVDVIRKYEDSDEPGCYKMDAVGFMDDDVSTRSMSFSSDNEDVDSRE